MNSADPPNPRTSSSRAALHKRPLVWVLLISLGVLPLLAYFWKTRPLRLLTDGETIRTSESQASPRDVLWQPPVPLAGVLNTSNEDYEPRLSWDGSTLYFVRGKAGGNADLYTSRRTPSGWSSPEPLDAINSDGDELGPEPSKDDRSLYFYSDRSGGSGGYDLWVTVRDDSGWQPPVNLGAAINSEWNDYGPALSPDGQRLYWSSNRPRGEEPAPDSQAWPATVREQIYRRTYDIYSVRLNASEQAAEPLVAVNTPYNDGAPCVSPLGDFLYFSSDRPGGAGGFDLYRLRRLDGQWGPLERLGDGINTPANELDPALWQLGYALIFASDRPLNPKTQSTAATQRAVDGLLPAPDYNLFHTVSREVYRVSEARPLNLDWAAILRALRANLWWLLAGLLALLLLLLGGKALRDPRLSLLTRCLLASLMLHFLIMLATSFWQVTVGILGEMRRPGSIRVHLATGDVQQSLAAQIHASFATVDMPETAPLAIRAFQQPPIPLPSRSPPEADPAPLAEAPVLSNPPITYLSVSVPSPARTTAQPLPLVRPLRARDAAVSDPLDLAIPAPAMRRAPAADESPVDPLATVDLDRTAPAQPAPLRRELPLPSRQPDAPAAPPSTLPPPAHVDAQPVLAATSFAQPTRVHSARSALVPNRQADPLEALDLAVPGAPAPKTVDEPVASAPPIPTPIDRAERTTASRQQALPLPTAPTANPPRALKSLEMPSIAISPTEASLPPWTAAPASPLVHAKDLSRTLLTPTPLAPLPLELPTPQAVDPAPKPLAQRDPAVRPRVLEKRGGSPKTEAAVQAALAWLAKHQEADGGWDGAGFGQRCDCDGAGEYAARMAMTGLATLCFLGAGHMQTAEGPYRETVANALEWILQHAGEDGDLRSAETMYSHGIATIALSEALAMTGERKLSQAAQAAVNFIVKARNRRVGGWRYEPGQEGDTSVLGWQVMALHSARGAGLEVPDTAWRNARAYLERAERKERPGAYAYRPGQRATVSMTAEGAFVHEVLGLEVDDRRSENSAGILLRHLPDWGREVNTYYWYYATLVLFHQQNEAWKTWNQALTGTLLAAQRKDGCASGSWDPDGEWAPVGGRIYQTALCTLMLEVYYRYLPMYASGQIPDSQPSESEGVAENRPSTAPVEP